MALEFDKDDFIDVVELSILENKINAGLVKYNDRFKYDNVAKYQVECKAIDPLSSFFNKVMFIDFKDLINPGSIQIVNPNELVVIFELYFYLIVRMINEYEKVKFLIYPPEVILNYKKLKEDADLKDSTIEFLEDLIENFEKIEDYSIMMSTINSAGSLIEMTYMPAISVVRCDIDENTLSRRSMTVKEYLGNFRKILKKLKEVNF